MVGTTVPRTSVQSATALPLSSVESRRDRMRKYSIAMSMRMVCLILVLALPGWWKLVFALGAVVFPWVAVVIANVGARGASDPVRPALQTSLPALPATASHPE